MKVEEMRGLGTGELSKEIESAHEELFNLRFRLATMQLRNHREVRHAKKKIAKLNTILREKELGIG